MKGIILAGGHGTRLYPVTMGVNKHLVPIYDKPMVYYSLSILMLAGIRDILVITTPQDVDNYERLLGDGSRLGCRFSYAQQQKPDGLAQAFVIGEKFIGKDTVALVLGDNFFFGSGMRKTLSKCLDPEGAIIFAHHVTNPQDYGVIEFDATGNIVSIEEKPRNPRSPYAIPGLYFYDNSVIALAKKVKLNGNGEYGITDINRQYLAMKRLKVLEFDRGTAWLDTGTFSGLIEASQFVHIIEKRQGFRIGCIEEIAYRMGFIDAAQVKRLAEPLLKSGYGAYLLDIINERYI